MALSRASGALGRPRSTRTRLLAGAVLLLVAILVLGGSALRLAGVRGDAEAARAELTEAMAALRSGDLQTAQARVAAARGHVDSARGRVDGFAGDVWSTLPGAGTAVDDVRRLVHALDDATAVAEIGVDVYPSVSGDEASLFHDDQLDLATLADVIAAVRSAGDRLRAADESLSRVEGSTPVIGEMIAARSEEAAAQITPMVETYAEVEPLLAELPSVFGAEGERSYLIAMLNPAELRFSGGAALSFASLSFDNGRLGLGETVTVPSDYRLRTVALWPPVRGNRLHPYRVPRVVNATFAPSWSVSGEELLRAWWSARQEEELDGVIAIDVVALARLVDVTGALTVPGHGELTGQGLVETLIGSYDDYYPDPTAQDSLNDALIPVFEHQFLSSGNYVAKAQALDEAADGRHFATFFRDADVQAGFAALGLDGDLASPDGDYLGVFTQNRNGSKVDYWQQRHISLDVTLGEDGSADHQLDVEVHNDTPPYALPVPDPRSGYFTRWAGMALGVFLPDGASVTRGSVRGRTWEPSVRPFYDHDFVQTRMLLEPDGRGRVRMSYEVRRAATVDESGNLTYRLAIDPQGTVNPASVQVRLHLPRGYHAAELPVGWVDEGDTITFQTDALEATQTFEVPIRPDS